MGKRLAALTVVVALTAPTIGAQSASAYPGAPGFLPGIVYEGNFPDPHVIQVDGVYIAYGTNTGGPKIPTMMSLDLETWVAHGAWAPEIGDTSSFGNDALVQTPIWAAETASGPEVWAPAIVETAAGWRAYFTIRATNGSRPRYCISVASGPGPLGPFRDVSTEPLTCGYGPAGAIDPWVYVDDEDTAWLLWTVEKYTTTAVADDDPHFPLSDEARAAREPDAEPRILPGLGASIWAQQLDDDATAFTSEGQARVLLIADTATWERGIVENPAMFTMNGQLHLLYSGNRWGSPDYATGWARCDTPLGPCERASGSPIQSANAAENGPGGASVFVDTHGEHQVAYHAWNVPYSSYPVYPACDTDHDLVCGDDGQRSLHITVLCTLPSGRLRVGLPPGWSFCDTDASTWRGPGVAWLSEAGITTGVRPHSFAPDRPITRAEVVTQLWRWAGSPQVEGTSAFQDLRSGAYYIDAVTWAASVGIVRGTTTTTFAPDEPVTRGQVATILHRAAGVPAAATAPGFSDVPAATYFTDAVAWLASNAITTGITPSTFAPSEPSTRAQFATMLCRTSRVEPAAEALVETDVVACPN